MRCTRFFAKTSLLFLTIYLFAACYTEGVKLNRGDRETIDTLSTRQISQLTGQMDNYCRDSSAMLIQRAVDSLIVVREREIMMQTQPVH